MLVRAGVLYATDLLAFATRVRNLRDGCQTPTLPAEKRNGNVRGNFHVPPLADVQEDDKAAPDHLKKMDAEICGDRARRAANRHDTSRGGLPYSGFGGSDTLMSIRNSTRAILYVKVAGVVISRQRPSTANGFMFLSLEDETGLANIIVRPSVFRRYKAMILDAPILVVYGGLEYENGAVHVMAARITDIRFEQTKIPPSRDWH